MKKIFAVLAALTVSVFALVGCGGQSASETKTLKVGATPVPHQEILELIAPQLEKEGIKLEIVSFTDYVQPNIALGDKELDANFFQHIQYLDNFIAEHPNLKLANAGGVHIEPMGVYSKKIKDLKDLPEAATIAIPNDPTNGGRSLLLLQKAGLIKLRDGAGTSATLYDITDNVKNLRFQEVEAAQVPRTLDDVDAAVINTNYAMQADLIPTRDALFMESSDSPYVNIIAVREGDENRPEIQALMKALRSDEVKNFLNEKYKGAILPAF